MYFYTRELRGIPDWLLRGYFVELGAQIDANGGAVGDGWRARLIPMEEYVIGSLRVEQIRLEWEGDDAAHELIWPLLERKLIRAGDEWRL